MSTIMIQLTPDKVPSELLSVHLHVAVEGLIFERMFEADPGIKYKFAWDRRNAYNQKVYGIVTASGESSIHSLYEKYILIFPTAKLCFSGFADHGLQPREA